MGISLQVQKLFFSKWSLQSQKYMDYSHSCTSQLNCSYEHALLHRVNSIVNTIFRYYFTVGEGFRKHYGKLPSVQVV